MTLQKLTTSQFLSRIQFENRNKKINRWIRLIALNKISCTLTQKNLSYVGRDIPINGVDGASYNFYTEDDLILDLDHLIPVQKGGANELHNIHILCQYLNSLKGCTDWQRFKRLYNSGKIILLKNEKEYNYAIKCCIMATNTYDVNVLNKEFKDRYPYCKHPSFDLFEKTVKKIHQTNNVVELSLSNRL